MAEVVLCGFRREAYVSRHQRQAAICGRSAEASVSVAAWCWWRRRACGIKRFCTPYGSAELADDLEEIEAVPNHMYVEL
jgi:hypothetical protein